MQRPSINKVSAYSLIAILLLGLTTPLHARDRDRDFRRADQHPSIRYDGHDHRRMPRSRVVWIIEGPRLVKRIVYVDTRGRYYRKVYGRKVYVRGRVFHSYPTRYY
jgi:hypothetical protein